MDPDTKRDGIDALETAINEKQEIALQNHSEILQYVHEVKDALNALVDKVAQDQEAASNLFADTRHDLEDYKQSLAEEPGDVGALREQVAELENAQADYENKIKSYKQKLEQSKRQLRDQAGASDSDDADRAHIADLETRLHETTEANDAAKRRIANLEDDLDQKTNLQSTAESLQHELDELRTQTQNHDTALDASRAALESMTHEYEAAQQQLDRAKATNVQFKQQLEAMTQAAAQHNYKLKELEEQHSSELHQAQQQRDEDQQHLHKQVETLESSLANASRKDIETAAQIAALDQQLKEEKEKNTKLNRQVADRIHSNVGHKEGINVLQDQIDQLESATDSNVQKISDLREELAQANAKAEKANKRLEELRSHAKKTLESEQEKAAALQDAQAELASIREDTESRVKLLNQCDALESQVTQLRDRNATIEEELADEKAKGTKSTLAKQLSEALQDYETSQKVNKDLREEIAALKKEHAEQSAVRKAKSTVIVEFDEVEAKQKLGDLLLETGVITSEQLAEVLREREEGVDHGKIGQAFIDKGFATEDVVVQALAHQMEIPFLRIEHDSIQHEAIRMISERIAEKHVCIPIRLENKKLIVAMQNPTDLIAIEDIERAGDYSVEPVISTSSDIREAINIYYQGKPSTL